MGILTINYPTFFGSAPPFWEPFELVCGWPVLRRDNITHTYLLPLVDYFALMWHKWLIVTTVCCHYCMTTTGSKDFGSFAVHEEITPPIRRLEELWSTHQKSADWSRHHINKTYSAGYRSIITPLHDIPATRTLCWRMHSVTRRKLKSANGVLISKRVMKCPAVKIIVRVAAKRRFAQTLIKSRI